MLLSSAFVALAEAAAQILYINADLHCSFHIDAGIPSFLLLQRNGQLEEKNFHL